MDTPFAKRKFGQNFLTDPNIRHKIVDALDVQPDDTLFEIGPGRGALTSLLARAGGRRVVALERDPDMVRLLAREVPQAQLILGDGLSFCWEGLACAAPLKLVGNLPYNVASPMLWEIAERLAQMQRGVFMVQLEVAQRLCAAPGTKVYGALSVWLQSFVQTRMLFKVPPTVFKPQPKVWSAVVELRPLPAHRRADAPNFLRTTLRRSFQKRRKQLGSIFAELKQDACEGALLRADIALTSRPEVLNPLQFQQLSKIVSTASVVDER